MKKINFVLVGLFALFFVLAAGSIDARKVSLGDLNTIVNGHVYQAGGHIPVFDEEVIATCNGRMAVDYTNAQGFYAMSIVRGCPAGAMVTACVQEGTNCRTGVVNNIGGYLIAYINLECEVGLDGHCA